MFKRVFTNNLHFALVAALAIAMALTASIIQPDIDLAELQQADAGRFVADFDTAADLDLFDWQVFHGGVDPFARGDQPRSWHGDHDHDCGAPTTLRQIDLVGASDPGPVSNAGDLVWWCAPRGAETGHVMTSMSLSAYGHVDFSPRQVFEDVSRVCWDQNWTEMGGRKWTQVAVIPEATFRANGGRMEYVKLSLQNRVAAKGLRVTGDGWLLEMLRASTKVQVGQQVTYTNNSGFQTADKEKLFRHCAIDQGDGTVRLELERPGGVTETRVAPGSFPDGPVRVIFQDVTYDSIKGALKSGLAQQTTTWHWDNIDISSGTSSSITPDTASVTTDTVTATSTATTTSPPTTSTTEQQTSNEPDETVTATTAPTVTETTASTVTTTTIPSTTTAPTVTATTVPVQSSVPTESPSTTTPVGSGAGRFVADFDVSADLDLFDWQVFHGGVDPFPRGDQPRSWHGDHDHDCGAPTTLRQIDLVGASDPGPVSNAGDLVWWCAPRGAETGHVMTSMSLIAYGHVDFSPRQVFEDVSRVCWDQNWTEMGGRKWTQVAVIPEATFRANGGRMEYVKLALQNDVAVNGLPVTGDGWLLEMLRASTKVQVGQQVTYTNNSGFQTADKAKRFRHCAIDQGDGTVRLEMERPGGVTETRVAPGSFPDGPVRVIFQDVTYDSIKGSIPFDQAQQTNTWHWDNIEIS